TPTSSSTRRSITGTPSCGWRTGKSGRRSDDGKSYPVGVSVRPALEGRGYPPGSPVNRALGVRMLLGEDSPLLSPVHRAWGMPPPSQGGAAPPADSRRATRPAPTRRKSGFLVVRTPPSG